MVYHWTGIHGKWSVWSGCNRYIQYESNHYYRLFYFLIIVFIWIPNFVGFHRAFYLKSKRIILNLSLAKKFCRINLSWFSDGSRNNTRKMICSIQTTLYRDVCSPFWAVGKNVTWKYRWQVNLMSYAVQFHVLPSFWI